MKKSILLGIIILAGCLNVQAQQEPNTATLFEHVIVIGIDGLSSEGLKKAEAPNLDRLIAEGAFKYDARVVLPSSSSSNWSAMILGAGPEITGITSNDWKPDGKYMKPVVANKAGRSPSIFQILREQRPDAEQGTVYHWGDFGRLFQKEVVNLSEPAASPEEAAQKFSDYVVAKKPVFAFLHLDHVDGAGHKYGHMTEKYLQAIAKADSLIGHVLHAIEQAGMNERTLVMIVSDHGGVNKGHGGESVAEITIPVIYYGNGIKKGYRVQQPVYQYDLAATIAFALNLKVPYSWTSRPVKAAFVGFEEPENLNIGLQ